MADIAFVLDGSGSVIINNWNFMLDFVKQFTASITYGPNQFGVISFGNEATLDIAFNQVSNYDQFIAALNKIPYKDENTNTAAGIRTARTQLFTDPLGEQYSTLTFKPSHNDNKPNYQMHVES